MKTKIDPYTGEEFIPKRRNQIFANTKNKSAFNNEKAAKLKEERSAFDKIIKRNYNILNLILNGKSSKIVNLTTLDDLDFKYNYYLSHERFKNQDVFYIYDISFENFKKENIIQTFIIRS